MKTVTFKNLSLDDTDALLTFIDYHARIDKVKCGGRMDWKTGKGKRWVILLREWLTDSPTIKKEYYKYIFEYEK
jgi:hypothetical protein